LANAFALGLLCISEGLGASGRGGCHSIGPDVIVRFYDVVSFGSDDGVAAFAFGTDACNVGDQVLDWVGDTPAHPVISSMVCRLRNNRFEQVGMSWLKHGWAADQADRCGCGCIPAGDNQHLGVAWVLIDLE
jgi:hypothetical protein